MRPAFTLIELLVAIVVFTVGVLALAASAGLVASQVGDGGRLTHAAHVAGSVLDSLRGVSCALARSGFESRGAVSVVWTVVRDSSNVTVELTTSSGLRRGNTTNTYGAVIPCRAP